jgi:hypothetical protein
MSKNPVKVNLTSSNLSEEKLKELRSILPEVFSEEKIDWERLRTVLGDNIDPRVEKFSFTWAGKSAAIKNVITPSTSTLRPAKDESVNFDTTENIFIEGDNLEAPLLTEIFGQNWEEVSFNLVNLCGLPGTGEKFGFKLRILLFLTLPAE